MKIIPDSVPNVLADFSSNSARPESAQRNEGVGHTGVRDTTTLSDLGTIIGSVVKRLEIAKDDRTERLNALRESIATGEYSVSPSQIAAAIQCEVAAI